MMRQTITIGLLILHTINIIPGQTEIYYQITNTSPKKSPSGYTEQHVLHALELLLIHKNNGYISHDLDGIQICVWDNYHILPSTIHPTYSIKLQKLNFSSQKDSLSQTDCPKNSLLLNCSKLDRILKNCDSPEVANKVKDMILQEKFGMIAIEKLNIKTIM